MLYVNRVELENFRCFERVVLEADTSGSVAPWTLLTGDNASGKTTLLKAIALGLCDGSSAAGLLRESDSGYIRDGRESSTITIDLGRRSGESADEYRIVTSLFRLTDSLERLEQRTDPDEGFPWEEIFVCGYGAGRGTAGTGDIAGYTAISAVYNLFNYSEGLQNPELTVRRLHHNSPERSREVLALAKDILGLSSLTLAEGAARDAGLLVTDHRGFNVALRDLADGYKSTFLWLTDFLGWALATQHGSLHELDGIVIIDELEQHLHPKWQKNIIGGLQDAWPRVQFFAATHAPLLAKGFRSLMDPGPHQHYHLQDSEDRQRVEAHPIASLAGERTDQVLASQAFDYVTDTDPDADQLLQELSLLSANPLTTADQRRRSEELLAMVEEVRAIRLGQTEIERSAAEWAEKTRDAILIALDADQE